MGTITARPRADGTTGYKAQLRIKRAGRIVYQETQTFDRRAVAVAWLRRREAELDQPGAIERARQGDPPLGEVIRRYMAETGDEAMGRTKRQVLRRVLSFELAEIPCSRVTSAELSTFARALGLGPVTTGNYLAHLAAVFAVARPAWGYPLDRAALADAQTALRRIGAVASSNRRDRRPTIEEMDRLMEHFEQRRRRRPEAAPMAHLMAFALFSTRRLGEIVRIRWADLEHDRVLVRDMKAPGHKAGNHVWCDLPEPARRVLALMPRREERIFPYKEGAVSVAFIEACKLLGIVDLHFHDLRHEGCSRLFELGATIPQVAMVSGHRSWANLKRYTHLRHTGDRWAAWPWLDRLGPA